MFRFTMALLGLLMLSSPFYAQILHGSLTGSARDPSGAAIPGVRVVLKNIETGQLRESTTNDTGAFVFATLLPGTCETTLTKGGFKIHK